MKRLIAVLAAFLVWLLAAGGASAKIPTSITLAVTPNPSTFGQQIAITAHLVYSGTPVPTGGICILDAGVVVNVCGLTPVKDETWHTSILTVGTHSLTATYPGDGNYSSSVSKVVSQVVKAPPVVATVSITFTFPFTVGTTPLVPTVMSVSPNTGPSGTVVTIKGTNFLPGATVRFGTTDSPKVTVVDANTITAVVP